MKVICINDGNIKGKTGITFLNNIDPVIKNQIYNVESEYIDKDGDLVYIISGNSYPRSAKRFIILPEFKQTTFTKILEQVPCCDN